MLGSALRLLDMPVLGPQPETVDVVSSVLGPREPDEEMTVSLARVLAERTREQLGDRAVRGIAEVRLDHSDETECLDLDGRQVSAVERPDERCYRLTMSVVMRES
jgi:hypothetical protein